ncbi:MAG: hypothetical protein KAU95_01515, partial [Candidatus Aenigmarchaeota archaeon]|nr:hypothetical protein [Candidatus Aenigmarchaeota archaeon]
MKKEILALFLVSLVVLISGCTLPWESGGDVLTAGTQGLAIKYFGPDVEHPFPGQTINIEARVQNVGVTDAKSISGKLYLITWPSTLQSTCTNLKPPNADMGRDGEECI